MLELIIIVMLVVLEGYYFLQVSLQEMNIFVAVCAGAWTALCIHGIIVAPSWFVIAGVIVMVHVWAMVRRNGITHPA